MCLAAANERALNEGWLLIVVVGVGVWSPSNAMERRITADQYRRITVNTRLKGHQFCQLKIGSTSEGWPYKRVMAPLAPLAE